MNFWIGKSISEDQVEDKTRLQKEKKLALWQVDAWLTCGRWRSISFRHLNNFPQNKTLNLKFIPELNSIGLSEYLDSQVYWNQTFYKVGIRRKKLS